jgi:hypothetical protein
MLASSRGIVEIVSRRDRDHGQMIATSAFPVPDPVDEPQTIVPRHRQIRDQDIRPKMAQGADRGERRGNDADGGACVSEHRLANHTSVPIVIDHEDMNTVQPGKRLGGVASLV